MEIQSHQPKITDIIINLQTGKGRAQTCIMSITLLAHMMMANQTTLSDLKMVIMVGEDLGREVKLTHAEVGETLMDARVVLKLLIRCQVDR